MINSGLNCKKKEIKVKETKRWRPSAHENQARREMSWDTTFFMSHGNLQTQREQEEKARDNVVLHDIPIHSMEILGEDRAMSYHTTF